MLADESQLRSFIYRQPTTILDTLFEYLLTRVQAREKRSNEMESIRSVCKPTPLYHHLAETDARSGCSRYFVHISNTQNCRKHFSATGEACGIYHWNLEICQRKFGISWSVRLLWYFITSTDVPHLLGQRHILLSERLNFPFLKRTRLCRRSVINFPALSHQATASAPDSPSVSRPTRQN